MEIDIEDELEAFNIFKKLTQTKVRDNESIPITADNVTKLYGFQNGIYNAVPLLIKDIQELSDNCFRHDGSVVCFQNSCICFRQCYILGRIVYRYLDKNYVKFFLNDSSGTLLITAHRNQNDINILSSLETEGYNLSSKPNEKHRSEIMKSVKNIIRTSIDHIETIRNLSIGSKVLIYGRPYRFRKQTCINIFKCLPNIEHKQDIELAYRTIQSNWYNSQRFSFL